MCNRFRMTAKQAELAARYGVASPYPEDLTIPPPELFPKRPAWVVRREDGAPRLDVMTWGVPTMIRNAKGQPIEKPVTNLRNLTSPFWRGMLSKPEARCLVPVTTFCEWAGEKGSMVAHWFSLPAEPIFSFAGVWRPSTSGVTFAFLTCGYLGDPEQHVVGKVHPKAMPVILHREQEDAWLEGAPAAELATCFPSQMMAVEAEG